MPRHGETWVGWHDSITHRGQRSCGGSSLLKQGNSKKRPKSELWSLDYLMPVHSAPVSRHFGPGFESDQARTLASYRIATCAVMTQRASGKSSMLCRCAWVIWIRLIV